MTIKFHCFIPQVARDMPIVKADEIDFEWRKRVLEDYKASKQSKLPVQTSSAHIHKCFGIRDVLKFGWIQRTYQDIEIVTTPGGEKFRVRTPFNQESIPNCGRLIGEYVSEHSPEQLHVFKPFSINTLPTVIKIQSPWFFTLPEGYSVLVMPVPYNDDNRFTAATGILKTNNFWNVQLYWHARPGKHIIKAGTPISQMIAIKNDTVDSEIEIVEDARSFLKENCPPYYSKYYK